jgi:hypothetical protein
MAIPTPTAVDLIRIIGDVIVRVDVLRSALDRNAPNRKKLDDLRDELDAAQRKLVRNGIDSQTAEFATHMSALKIQNNTLKATIDSVGQLARTLESLVAFTNIVQRIVALIA